jgi:hypothetical protein
MTILTRVLLWFLMLGANGYALHHAWNWLAVPLFEAPAIAYLPAVAGIFLVRFAVGNTDVEPHVSDEASFLETLVVGSISALLEPAVVLGLAYLLRLALGL